MVQAVRMPMMGNTMETGLVVEWVVSEGDPVNEDDVIAIVESEKASTDIIAIEDGTIARIDVEEGEEVPPGTLIGVVLGPGESLEDAPEPRSRIEPGRNGDERETTQESTEQTPGEEQTGNKESGGTSTETVPAAPGARKLAEDQGVQLSDLEGTGPEGAVLHADVEEHLEQLETPQVEQTDQPESKQTQERVFASPSARRLAMEQGLQIDDIEGTGIGGRVTESDILNASEKVQHRRTANATSTDAGELQAGREMTDADLVGVTIVDEQSLSGVRRTIADRMAQSAREAPHVTLNREVMVERAFQMVDDLTKFGETPVGFTDVLIAATVRALDHHPRFNAWFEGDKVRKIAERNIAIAVDSDTGLVTPVIRGAGNRSLQNIAENRRELTNAVLEADFSMDDLQGATFTISNLGMFGVDSFDPIIAPPQVAILGVGGVHGGEERRCTLSLSFDHRVVDGADAARFLSTLAESVEAPTIVFAESSAVEGAETEGIDSQAGTTASDATSIDELVERDISEQAPDIAAVHNWPTPTYEVRVDEGSPSITVHAPEDALAANMKRLTYAACRDSKFTGTIIGLRNPEIEID